MEAWTRRVIRHRKKIIVLWLLLFAFGVYGVSHIGDLLSNRFSVPGSDAENGLNLVKDRLHERGDGAFTLIGQTERPIANTPQFLAQLEAAAQKGASALHGRPSRDARWWPIRDLAYVQINTSLENADSSNKTPAVRAAIPDIPGTTTYVSGFPAINHDTQKIYNEDLAKGETIAIPIALLVLAFMFGTLVAIGVPLAFAAVSIPTTLGIVWIFAHYMDMAVYVTNIVSLIGFAIAIDYSMLVVFRFREELEQHDSSPGRPGDDHANGGRATLFSGGTVAIGLALLVLMPLPFMRSMGVGGLLVPLVSIAASATFLPACSALLGRKVNRFRVIPKSLLQQRAEGRTGFWTRLSQLDHAPPGRLSRRRHRRDARAGAPGSPAAPHRRRQPGRPTDHRVHQGPEAARGLARPRRARAEPDRGRHRHAWRRLRSGHGGSGVPAGRFAQIRSRDPAEHDPGADLPGLVRRRRSVDPAQIAAAKQARPDRR